MRYPPNPAVWVRTDAGVIVKGNDTSLSQLLSPPINSTGDLMLGEGVGGGYGISYDGLTSQSRRSRNTPGIDSGAYWTLRCKRILLYAVSLIVYVLVSPIKVEIYHVNRANLSLSCNS